MNNNENIANPCFLFEMQDYWQLRICGYTFTYNHSRTSAWYNNHAYVQKEKYDLLGCKKISSKEALLMLLEVEEKGIFNTDTQKEMWELAAAMLSK